MFKEIKGRFRSIIIELGKDGEVLLERVPEDLRKSIWNSEPDNLYNTMAFVNEELESRNLPKLSAKEEKDAQDGNHWKNLQRGERVSARARLQVVK